MPFAFVSTPALLFQGSLAEMLIAAALTTAGIGAVTVGIAGYWARPLGPVLRLACVALGGFSLPLGFLAVPQAVHGAAALAIVALAVTLVALRGGAGAAIKPADRS